MLITTDVLFAVPTEAEDVIAAPDGRLEWEQLVWVFEHGDDNIVMNVDMGDFCSSMMNFEVMYRRRSDGFEFYGV